MSLVKCCPVGSGIWNGSVCREGLDGPFEVSVYRFADNDAAPHRVDTSLPLVVHQYQCPKFTLEPGEPFYLLENGSLWVPTMSLIEGTFCMDYFGLRNETLPFICFGAEEDVTPFRIYPVGMIISIPFLLATLAFYCCLPDLKGIHAKCVTVYVTCLILSYTSLSFLQLFQIYLNNFVCPFIGYTIQYAFLATFFWLNVMCFDTCSVLRGMKQVMRSHGERKKFLYFSMYGWGVPLVILGVTLFVEYAGVLSKKSPIKPRFGESRCFFSTVEGQWLFFYGPMAGVILSNAIMFGLTVQSLVRHRRDTVLLNRKEKDDRETFSLYLKLFLLMGVNWGAELVSSLLGGPASIWYLTDVTNTLQGVFIFFILVYKKRLLLQAKARFFPSKRSPEETELSGTTKSTEAS